jgi:hypothetical protein
MEKFPNSEVPIHYESDEVFEQEERKKWLVEGGLKFAGPVASDSHTASVLSKWIEVERMRLGGGKDSEVKLYIRQAALYVDAWQYSLSTWVPEDRTENIGLLEDAQTCLMDARLAAHNLGDDKLFSEVDTLLDELQAIEVPEN